MKNLLLANAYLIFFLSACFADGEKLTTSKTPTSDYFCQQWLDGKKTEIADVAFARLMRNPNDVSSLSIKFDYFVEFFDANEIRKIIHEIRHVVKRESVGDFTYEMMTGAANSMEDVLPQVTEQMIKEEYYKRFITGKPLPSRRILLELEGRGKLPLLTATEKNYIEGKITKEEFLIQSGIDPAKGISKFTPVSEPSEVKSTTNNFSARLVIILPAVLILTIAGFFFIRRTTTFSRKL